MRNWLNVLVAVIVIMAMVLPLGSVTATTDIGMTDDDLHDLVIMAYIYSFPVYEMYRTRYTAVYDQENPARTDLNEFLDRRELLDHTDRRVVSPNNDTLYSSAWLDLSLEPVILSVPDTNGRYYVMPFMDFYTNVFDSVGMRTTGTEAGDYVIAGPEWDGETPDGLPVIGSPTNSVWLIGRTLVDGEWDLPDVHEIQDQYELTPLSLWEDPEAEAKVITDLENPPPAPDPEDPWNFFEIVNIGMTENPPPDVEAPLMCLFAQIGVGPGQTFDPDRFTPEQKEVVLTAMHIARTMAIFAGAAEIERHEGWTYLPTHVGNYGDDYFFRALMALIGLGAVEPAEAVYYGSETDKDGNPYDAQDRYILRFEKEDLPPVDAFWSISLYELKPDGRRFFTENPIDRYSIGDRTEGLQYGEDGSLEIYIQRQPPSEDKLSNWLPAPSSVDAFTLTLRCYLPGEAIVTGEYRVPGVEALLEVAIDIRPGIGPNPVNPRSRGVIPVAILTTEDFDATEVDPGTVRFGPAGASPVRYALEDVSGDGSLDMILHFRTQETGIQDGDTSATLTGWSFTDLAFFGTDAIITVP